MIRVNLLAIKRKKKAKPLPAFVISATLVTVLAVCVLAYLVFYFNSKLQTAKGRVEANKKKIEELKEKIKEVENFEKLNKTIDEKNKLIEQLRRNQNIPVMMLDELSRGLPNGVWIVSLTATGSGGTVEGFAFTNADVVTYVETLKSSKLLTDVYLQESKQAQETSKQTGGGAKQAREEVISLYRFKLTFKVAT
jgi:type IV pilus assembly protein PilN